MSLHSFFKQQLGCYIVNFDFVKVDRTILCFYNEKYFINPRENLIKTRNISKYLNSFGHSLHKQWPQLMHILILMEKIIVQLKLEVHVCVCIHFPQPGVEMWTLNVDPESVSHCCQVQS